MHNKQSSLVILDWDDTLFPTSWVIKYEINVMDKNKYINMFAKLDAILYELFTKCLSYAHVVIITNAAVKWVNYCLGILPNTKKIVHAYVDIMSAKDKYKQSYPNDIYSWKRYSFERYSQYNNITSIGDAEYEYEALIGLDNGNKLLKAIKFIKMPNYDILLDQVSVVNKNIAHIILMNDHVDYNFKYGNVC